MDQGQKALVSLARLDIVKKYWLSIKKHGFIVANVVFFPIQEISGGKDFDPKCDSW